MHESKQKLPNKRSLCCQYYLGHRLTFHKRAHSLLVKLAEAVTYVSS